MKEISLSLFYHLLLNFGLNIFKLRELKWVLLNSFFIVFDNFFGLNFNFWWWFFLIILQHLQYSLSLFSQLLFLLCVSVANYIFYRGWWTIRNTICKIFTWNINCIEFLSLFDFTFYLVLFSKRSKLLILN